MSNNAGYVICDEEEHYVGNNAYTLTGTGWLYSYFTGVTTGFTWHNSLITVKEKITKLQKMNQGYGFNKKFHMKYIDNIKELQKGKLIIEKIVQLSCNKKIVNE